MRLARVYVAGEFPFGEHGRVVLEGVAHNRPQVTQGFARRGICAGQSRRGVDLLALPGGLPIGGTVKRLGGLVEMIQKIGGQIHGQKRRFQRRGILQKLPGGGEQRAMTGAARQAELGVQPRRAEIGQRVRALADGLQLIVQIGMNLRFGEGGFLAVAGGGFLVGGLPLCLRHGGGHLRKQRGPEAADGEFGRVFEAEVFGALEGICLVSLNRGHKC